MNVDRDPIEVTPLQAEALHAAGVPLLDIRTPDERASGMPRGALAVAAAELDAWLARMGAPQGVLLICASGRRSLRAAAGLRACGIAARSVAGGLAAWIAAALPLSQTDLDVDARARYARQLCLPEVGAAGQARLAQASVALVGAGGLGAPTALYLAAAGVGRITLIDNDVIERSNLQRQVLYSDAEVGQRKVEAAARRLQALNPDIAVEACVTRLDADNAVALLAGHDVLVDGADNFPARYALSAASLQLRLPMVYGAVERFAGQVSVFDPRRADSPCYRCLFPYPPAPGEVPSCVEVGVLGVVPGMAGLLQASEVLKLLLGIGKPLVGRLLLFDALDMRWRESTLPRDTQCPGCGPRPGPLSPDDVTRYCGA
ncbi:molybdopterin-synthase adenylyltransferase MoeB [Metallibacterium scheffleri]|jgi:molybdopterin/thiamine biosynthesis adenylyltransferase/rhodanese-related sulfurtransferase|uniref:molybdopterin-synthase adenylyltransferase MoeB n=2 Tax=Metallibacterium TaxID=1218803 RepID=UPI0026EB8143|nr:molybdopterin-synthase adenylyltransferase MoeB [Metallibacterium scheffleri]MBW8074042.1 molybdopterin-synthase adenylyltransferase MoeB [Metallibacterium scheffleri]